MAGFSPEWPNAMAQRRKQKGGQAGVLGPADEPLRTGAWGAQRVEPVTLGLGSGHGPRGIKEGGKDPVRPGGP